MPLGPGGGAIELVNQTPEPYPPNMTTTRQFGTPMPFRYLTLLIALCGSAACTSPAPQPANEITTEQTPTIKLLSPGSTEKGMLVTCEKKVLATGPHAGEVAIRIINCLDEDVFIQTQPLEALHYSLKSSDGGYISGGGGGILHFGGGTPYVLLDAASYKNGKRIICGCCIFNTKASIAENARRENFQGTVTVRITGIYRKTGKSFSERIDLPIEVVAE